jgi:hypothetical protein
MKLQGFLNEVVEKFKKITEEELLAYIKHTKDLGNYQDLKTRIVWDCLWNFVGSNRIADWKKTIQFNDNHLDTLTKKAFKLAFPNIKL